MSGHTCEAGRWSKWNHTQICREGSLFWVLNHSMHELKEVWKKNRMCMTHTINFCEVLDEISYGLFRKSENGMSCANSTPGKPLLTDVSQAKFENGSPKLFFQRSLEHEGYSSCNFLKKNAKKSIMKGVLPNSQSPEEFHLPRWMKLWTNHVRWCRPADKYFSRHILGLKYQRTWSEVELQGCWS